ncbi:MAG: TM1266 family iron-only hydrogenase system putative regulator [Pseudomonadota bacterium]
MDKRIGTVTVIITNRLAQAAQVNAILGEHGDAIIGRMGIPYVPRGLNIIALIVHASTDEIGALTGKLGALNGIQVKSALTRV